MWLPKQYQVQTLIFSCRIQLYTPSPSIFVFISKRPRLLPPNPPPLPPPPPHPAMCLVFKGLRTSLQCLMTC